MKYGKTVNGIVKQVQPYSGDGFKEIPDNVYPEMLDNGDGTFSSPEPEVVVKTSREKRAEAYIEQFSPEKTFQHAVGDSLDSILDFIETGVISTELQGLLDIRTAIKAANPK